MRLSRGRWVATCLLRMTGCHRLVGGGDGRGGGGMYAG
jgi:hypothetical protein